MATTSVPVKRSAEASSANDRPTKRTRYDYGKTIAILVGPEKHRFITHQDAICVKSKFFRAACSRRWLEGQERVLRLPEVRSKEVFQIYMDWAYTNELSLELGIDELGAIPLAAPMTEYETYDRLIEIYLLGDFLDDVRIRNEALRSLNTYTSRATYFCDSTQLNTIWNHSSSNSLLRSWVVDIVVSVVDHTHIEVLGANCCPDLVLQIAKEAMSRMKDYRDGMEGVLARLPNYLESVVDA